MEAVACLKMFCTSAINLGPSSRNHNADTINWAPSTISLLRAICPSLRASLRFLGVGCSVFASMLYCFIICADTLARLSLCLPPPFFRCAACCLRLRFCSPRAGSAGLCFCCRRCLPRREARLQIRSKLILDFRMTQREFDRCLKIAEFAAAVETHALIAIGERLFVVHQRSDRIGQLQLAARAWAQGTQVIKNARLQIIAPDTPKFDGASSGAGFSIMPDRLIILCSHSRPSMMPYERECSGGISSTPISELW